jgi:hypothetical protein
MGVYGEEKLTISGTIDGSGSAEKPARTSLKRVKSEWGGFGR